MHLVYYCTLVLTYCVFQSCCCTIVTFIETGINVGRLTESFSKETFTAKITGCITPQILKNQLGEMIISSIEIYNQSVPILHEGAIADLPDVHYITISYSKVKTVKERPFVNLPKLTSLTLSSNVIEFVDKNAFENLNLLTVLDLSDNKIIFLEDEIFASLTKLSYVYLFGNNLEIFEGDWFGKNTNLHTIDLHNNFIKSIHKSTFKEFKTLNTLDLSINRIQFIHKDAFANLADLDTLYLYDNRMKKLEPDVFQGLKKIASVWIHGNNLTYMPDKILKDLNSPELFQITLHTNPWQCACYHKIAEWASKRNVFIVTGFACYNDNNPVCLYPTENEDLCLENREEDLNKIFYDSYNVGDHDCE